MEKLLFKEISQIYICDILYILNINNWEKNIQEFSKFFNSEKRKKFIKGRKKIKRTKIDEAFLKFIEKFNVSIEELAVARPDISMECKSDKSPSYYINITGGCGTHKKYNLF